MYTIGTIRKFRTRDFTVIVDAVEEDAPDLSWDEDGEIARKIESGDLMLFCARARVLHRELGELASDYLGNCVYESLESFQDHRLCGAENRKLRESGSNARGGSYFADMVRTVCAEARKQLLGMREELNGLHVRV